MYMRIARQALPLSMCVMAATWSSLGHALEQVGSDRPNIIFILADDLGWGDVRCNNRDAVFETPNIDRLANEGVRFTNAFTSHSVCSPTRYALLTGRYAWRTWMREGVLFGYGKSLIPPERMTLASLLHDHGYRTGVFGKWHVGMDWEPVPGDPGDWHWGTQVRAKGVLELIGKRVDHCKPLRVGPTHIGFDTAFVTPSNNTRIPVFVRDDRVEGKPEFDETGLIRDPRVQRDTVDDMFRAEAVKFIDSHLASYADRPFFLYLPLNVIHGTTLAPKRFERATGDGGRSDKVLWLDESVGVILDALDKRGLTENTMVFFSSDNGPIAPKRYNPETQHRAAGLFRGYKADAWDGGFRVPFVVRWPGHIEAGSTHDGILCLSDMIATFAALVDEELPEWAGEDSINQLPAILGETRKSLRDELVAQSEIGLLSIRKNGWKLILDTKGSGGHGNATPGFEPVIKGPPWEIRNSLTGQLYHIAVDPYEQNDLYEGNPKKVKELQELLARLISEGRSR